MNQSKAKYFVRLGLLLLAVVLTGCFNRVILSPGIFGQDDRNLKEAVVFSEVPPPLCGLFGKSQDKVLLIPIQGFIGESTLRRSGTSPGNIYKILQNAAGDGSIKALLLKIDSPGGTVNASDLIYRMLSDFGKDHKLKIYVHIDGVGASGAYYIAMAGKHINARPASITGSIGVILQSFSVRGLLDKAGIEYRSITSGPNKDILSPFREMRADEKAFLQGQVNQTYERFLKVILESRGSRLTEARLREAANGNIYSPEQALAFGLIDSSLYLDEYLSIIKSETGIRSLTVVSYIPENRSEPNLYETESEDYSTMAELMSLFSMLQQNRLYYLWEAGFR